MVKVSQQLNLSQCSQTEHSVFKGLNALNSDCLTSGLVQGRTENKEKIVSVSLIPKRRAILFSVILQR
jgi:hypothetical protein